MWGQNLSLSRICSCSSWSHKSATLTKRKLIGGPSCKFIGSFEILSYTCTHLYFVLVLSFSFSVTLYSLCNCIDWLIDLFTFSPYLLTLSGSWALLKIVIFYNFYEIIIFFMKKNIFHKKKKADWLKVQFGNLDLPNLNHIWICIIDSVSFPFNTVILEGNFCVSTASCIVTLLRIDLYLPQNAAEILLMWPAAHLESEREWKKNKKMLLVQ